MCDLLPSPMLAGFDIVRKLNQAQSKYLQRDARGTVVKAAVLGQVRSVSAVAAARIINAACSIATRIETALALPVPAMSNAVP
jgi:hypothetical protein